MDQQRRTIEVELIGGPADGRRMDLPESVAFDNAIEVETARGFSIYRRDGVTGRFVYATWRPA